VKRSGKRGKAHCFALLAVQRRLFMEAILFPSQRCPASPLRWLARLKNYLLARLARPFPAAEAAQRDALAERLLDSYGNAVLRLAYSYLHNLEDAEDVLQETLIRCLQAQPTFVNQAHEKAWLLRVAANLSKDRIGYNKLRGHEDLDELEGFLIAEQREDLSFVWEAVKQLPVRYRAPIHLFYYEGCSVEQIADILSRKPATVRSDLHRGRDRLKAILKEAFDFEPEIP